MNLKFTEKDFSKFRNFQDHLSKEFGENTCVGTESSIVVFEYSPKLKSMLRPYPSEIHFEFKLSQLCCKKCKKNKMFLCLTEEIDYLCTDCIPKKSK